MPATSRVHCTLQPISFLPQSNSCWIEFSILKTTRFSRRSSAGLVLPPLERQFTPSIRRFLQIHVPDAVAAPDVLSLSIFSLLNQSELGFDFATSLWVANQIAQNFLAFAALLESGSIFFTADVNLVTTVWPHTENAVLPSAIQERVARGPRFGRRAWEGEAVDETLILRLPLTVDEGHGQYVDVRGGFSDPREAAARDPRLRMGAWAGDFIDGNFIVSAPAMEDEDPRKGASPTAIENLKRVRIATADGDGVVLGDSCVVCLEDFSGGDEAIQLPCAHFYHASCIVPWLKQNGSCPTCRHKIEA